MNSPFSSFSPVLQESGPKYCQIIDLILKDIDRNVFRPGDRIPSIKETSEELLLSRDTVEKAYRELSQRGVLISVPGKGYYVKGKTASSKLRVLSLLPCLGAQEQSMYATFLQTLGKHAVVHLRTYQHDEDLFQEVLGERLGDYDYYLVWTRFSHTGEKAARLLKKIPQNKLIQLGKKPGKVAAKDPEMAKTITRALQPSKSRLAQYQGWTLLEDPQEELAQEWSSLLGQVAKSFKQSFTSQPLPQAPEKGVFYLCSDNRHLLSLIRQGQEIGLAPGKDFGLLHLQEHPLLPALAGGISSLSFLSDQLGKDAADLILQKTKDQLLPQVQFHARASI